LLTADAGFSNVDANGQLINSARDANAADWSPAGDDIAFWAGQESCFGQIWRIRADGAGRTPLTEHPIPSHNDDPAWSPDGQRVLFTTDRCGRAELWVMDADGSNERFVTENAPGPGPADAAWQPIWD
jgi:TolB protein